MLTWKLKKKKPHYILPTYQILISLLSIHILCKCFSVKKNISVIIQPLHRHIGLVVECLPMARETEIQSQVKSYQRLKKWYLMLPCLTLSIIRYVSRVKWSNPGKGVAPFTTPRCSSNWKGSFRVALDYGHRLYSLLVRQIWNLIVITWTL